MFKCFDSATTPQRRRQWRAQRDPWLSADPLLTRSHLSPWPCQCPATGQTTASTTWVQNSINLLKHTHTHTRTLALQQSCICMCVCACELSISCPIKQATRQQQQQQLQHQHRLQLQMKLQRCLVKAMWIAQNPSHLSRCQLHFAYAICHTRHMPLAAHTYRRESVPAPAVLKGAALIRLLILIASQSIEAAAVWLLANCFSRTLFNYYVSSRTHTHTHHDKV